MTRLIDRLPGTDDVKFKGMLLAGGSRVVDAAVIDFARCPNGYAVLQRDALCHYCCRRRTVTERLRRTATSLAEDGCNVALHVRPGTTTCAVVTQSGALLCYTLDVDAPATIRYAQTIRLKAGPELLALTTDAIWFSQRGSTELRRIAWSSSSGSTRSECITLQRPLDALFACGERLVYKDDTGHVLAGPDLGPIDAICHDAATVITGRTLRTARGGLVELPFAAHEIARSEGGRHVVLTHAGGCAVLTETGTLVGEHTSERVVRAIFGADDASLLLLQDGELLELELCHVDPFTRLVQHERGIAIWLRQGDLSRPSWYHVELPSRCGQAWPLAALKDDQCLAVALDHVRLLSLTTGQWVELESDDDPAARCTHLVWLERHLVVASSCASGEDRLLLYGDDELLDVVALPAAVVSLHASGPTLQVALDNEVLYILKVEAGTLTKTGQIDVEYRARQADRVVVYEEGQLCLTGQQLYLGQVCIADDVDAFMVQDQDLWVFGGGRLDLYDPLPEKLLTVACKGVPLAISDDLVDILSTTPAGRTTFSLESRFLAPRRLCADLGRGRRDGPVHTRLCSGPARSHVLEVALYEALERNDDPLVRLVWRLIGSDSEQVEVLQSLLRKTDVATWRRLFGAIGRASAFYEAALARRDLRAACNLLLAVISVEGCDAGMIIAELLRQVTDAGDFGLARELLRFAKSSDVMGADLFARVETA